MNAAQQLLTEHIDIWTAADTAKKTGRGRNSGNTTNIYGIKKLRELILELAVRGKLVPQDPNDEPASELLKRIQAEKAKLIAEGKINKDKPLPQILDKEKPFELPKCWEWVRFGTICGIERGGSPRPIKSFLTDSPEGLNWIKIGDTEQGGKYITSSSEKITKDGLSKTRMVYPGDFLLTNSMSFGRPYITKIEGCIHDGWLRISPPESIDKDYLYSLLSSPYVSGRFKAAAAGAVVMNLNSEKVRELFIPIPPLAEQHRIVAKVDELMELCDQLETQHNAAAEAHDQLVSHLLGTLTQSQSAEDFSVNWQRIAGHFDTLFTTEVSIDALKQTLLQLAVMGKLVPQDPNDEPASELLKRIQAEKAKLIAEGKINKGKPLAEIAGDEEPFDLPKNWEWVRLGDVSQNVQYGYTASADHIDRNVLMMRITDIQENQVNWKTVPGCSISESDFASYALSDGDIVIARTGGTIGKSYLISDLSDRAVFASYLIRVQKLVNSLPSYTKVFLGSLLYWNQLFASSMGTGQPNVNGTALKSLIFPLPPLAEQHRIVAKVDELMALCEELKFRITEANQLQQKLADVVVEQAIA